MSLLPGDQVHVWAWMANHASPELANQDWALLNSEERLRMERFRFPVDQQRFRICHANLRRILAGYLGCQAKTIEFAAGKDGRPTLSGSHTSRLDFNLSHSKTMGMLAVSSNLKVGIDIEDIRPIEWELAEKHFSIAELDSLRALGENWLDGFFRCWTSKEALLKAEGVGLQIPLHSFDVSIAANEAPALIAKRPDSLFELPWRLFDVTPAAGCRATLAVSETPLEIRHLYFDP